MRLIDADALEKDTEWSEYEDDFVSYSQLNIDCAPTVDAVPVVRCKDCKHGELLFTWDDGTERYLCQIHSLVDMPSNWFCKDGERKENGTD